MKKIALGVLVMAMVAAAALSDGGKAEAATAWSGHFETPYVVCGPGCLASLEISPLGGLYLVRLHDAIPAEAWNNPECHGPADATGIGLAFASNQMAVWFRWSCADGSTRFSVRYLRFNDGGVPGPGNDEIVFCNSLDFSTCGLVFHRT